MVMNGTPGDAETDWGRVALICLLGGMNIELLLSLVWLGMVWFNGIQPIARP
jgi:hypothetical protein